MKPPVMNRGLALLLQVVVVVFGLCALVFLLGEPHLEGRNAHATMFEIYFKDPFLAYVYVGSIPVFVAFQRAFGLLGHARRTAAFSPASVHDLRTIRRCALIALGFVGGAVVIILMFGDGEDRPAGIFMSALAASATGATATAAGWFARRLQGAFGRGEGGRA